VKTLLLVNGILCLAFTLEAQAQEAVVKKETLSVHTVERGAMSIFSSATGTLTSL